MLHTSLKPDSDWPANGKVELKAYSTRYRDGLPLVLKNVDVSAKPGEKVGNVSGKVIVYQKTVQT